MSTRHGILQQAFFSERMKVRTMSMRRDTYKEAFGIMSGVTKSAVPRFGYPAYPFHSLAQGHYDHIETINRMSGELREAGIKPPGFTGSPYWTFPDGTKVKGLVEAHSRMMNMKERIE